MTRSRVVQRRRTGLIATLAAVLFLFGLLGVEPRDDAWLLQVAGRPVDLRGAVSAAVQDFVRDCSRVRRLDAMSAEAAPAVAALREFSPPDSRTVRVLRMDHLVADHARGAEKGGAESHRRAAHWYVLQAEFDALEPVVVAVRQAGPHAEVMPLGVWSSTTRPWHSAWRIRRFLAERVPQVPADLLACVDPLPVFEQPPRPAAPTREEASRHRL